MNCHLHQCKRSGRKLVSQSDVPVDTALRHEINRRCWRIRTWNVKSLRRFGKLENLKLEMQILNIYTMEVGEVRLSDLEDF